MGKFFLVGFQYHFLEGWCLVYFWFSCSSHCAWIGKCSWFLIFFFLVFQTPCGHNFCLKCFQRWIGQGKRTCAYCRVQIPPKIASQPRINSTLVIAIRMARMSRSSNAGGAAKVYHFVHNQNRPDKAYTTERAKKAGKANACSGKIFVTVAPDHFGPIPAENDPERNMGVLVGEIWEDRLACRQWGAHLPHVAGIAGQSTYGAQSVALSGGYIDDEDHGEWFLYTGRYAVCVSALVLMSFFLLHYWFAFH